MIKLDNLKSFVITFWTSKLIYVYKLIFFFIIYDCKNLLFNFQFLFNFLIKKRSKIIHNDYIFSCDIHLVSYILNFQIFSVTRSEFDYFYNKYNYFVRFYYWSLIKVFVNRLYKLEFILKNTCNLRGRLKNFCKIKKIQFHLQVDPIQVQ